MYDYGPNPYIWSCEVWKHFEENYLKEQLKRFKGNIAKTSTYIGMDRSALHRKLKELNININIYN